jgi:hypothetical protein
MLEVRERVEDIRLARLRAEEVGAEEQDSEWVPSPAREAVASAPGGPSATGAATGSRTRVAVAALGAILVIALLAVVLILPGHVEREQQARRAEAEASQHLAELNRRIEAERAAAQAEPETRELTEEELEALFERREATEAILDDYLTLQISLEERAVERWASDDFEVAQDLQRSGDEPFRLQQYELASEAYRQALNALQELDSRAGMVLAEALERGYRALQSGLAAAATDAFELALQLDPESDLATRGAQRAAVLDQVLALRDQAMAAEASDDLAEALARYREALALDAETTGLAETVARLSGEIADRSFRKAMSEGLAALEEDDWSSARDALSRAQSMRPGDRAPKDALLEVERRYRDARILEHRTLALAAEREERWAQAVKHYEALAELDQNLELVQSGLERARDRNDLDQRLAQFLEVPQRWWSDEGRQQAQSLLYDAKGVESPGARLSEQITALAQQLDLASRPVDVTLVSDSACNVVVYKVGRLGTFDQHQLSLRPGHYTAVGTRDGYRDVRKDFMVFANRRNQPVVLRCEEEV